MLMKHLVNQVHKSNELRQDNTLHVVGVITNPSRYHSRYRLYREWVAALEATANVKVYTVEAAFGDRHHEITESGHERHLQLRTKSPIWIKENLINLAEKWLLPQNWKYICWVDCDVFFRDPHWATETLHQLQHFHVVQPWSDCVDLGPHGNILQHFKSFGAQHQRRCKKQKHPSQPYEYAHTGYAMACDRYFWENTGGLPDFCILGSADHHLAFACIGEVKDTIHGKMSCEFHQKLIDWERKALMVTHGEVGFVHGRIEHMWHGKKKERKYRERWQILIDHEFNPDEDLMKDDQGLIQLRGKAGLKQAIHMYNVARREDSIDEW